MPSAGHRSSATARTVSKSAASSPGAPAAAIQFAESFTSDSARTGAAARLVSASATAIRPDAGASIDGERRALADGERLARVAVERQQRRGAVGDRHLPRADALIARAQAADRPVANRDEERLVGDGRRAQDAIDRVGDGDAAGVERAERRRDAARRRASCAAACRAGPADPCRPRRCRTAASCTTRRWSSVAVPTTANGQRSRSQSARKRVEVVGRDGQHVALLRLVAPDLARRHAGLLVRRRAQVDARAAARAVGESRAGRSTGRRRRRRGSRGSGCASPSAQHRSMTSCARRWISALPRCTESKSRSAVLAPVAIDEAEPPPMPISMPGPPIWMNSAPAGTSALCAWSARMLPTPPASMIGLW